LLKYIGKNGELLGIDFFDRIQDENELVSVADNPSYAKALSDMEAKLAHELIFIDIKKNQLPGKRFVNKMNRKNVKN
jgi:hypothetical protein